MTAAETNLQDQPEEWSEPSDRQAEEDLSIGHRMGNWKTLASFAFAVVVLGVAISKANVNPSEVWARARNANMALYFAAFLVYYCTFPIRGYRWKLLLRNVYDRTHAREVEEMSVKGLTEIIYISWFANCVVPAKLGDLYRAYLAKLWVSLSWAKTIGTIVAERIIDVLVLSAMLSASAFLMFHNRLGHVGMILILGVGLAAAGAIGLIVMKTFSEQIHRFVPERFRHRYTAFEEGTLHSFQRLPLLLGLTIVVWLFEGARIQLVFSSLGMSTHISGATAIPFVPMLFFALTTAVLTTLPFTPGGLGLVEAGLLSIMVYFGIPAQDATVVVLFDRILSYMSVAVLGFGVYLISKRSHFRHPI